MPSYPLYESGVDTLTEHRHVIQENNLHHSCSITKKTLIGTLIFFSIAVVFAGGYLLRHYVEINTVNDWLGSSQNECKNIASRQIYNTTSASYLS